VEQAVALVRLRSNNYDIISNILGYDSMIVTFPWLLWLHVLYNVAWDFPEAAGFVVRGMSRTEEDKALGRGGPPCPPFTGRVAFEQWGTAQSALPKGEHWLWLSQDVRLCTVLAIDALLAAFKPGAPGRAAMEKDWIYGSQTRICKALGYSGTRPRHLEILKEEGVISELEKIHNSKWKVIIRDPEDHARVKGELTPKPRKDGGRKRRPSA
jgi:hypothetical protein